MWPGSLALHLHPWLCTSILMCSSFCNYYIFSSFQCLPLTIMLPVLWVIFPMLNYLTWIPFAWLDSGSIVNKPTVFKIYSKWCMHFWKGYSYICGFSEFILVVLCYRSLSVADFKLATLLKTYSWCSIKFTSLLLTCFLEFHLFPRQNFYYPFPPNKRHLSFLQLPTTHRDCREFPISHPEVMHQKFCYYQSGLGFCFFKIRMPPFTPHFLVFYIRD